jgi:hypothetical protein
MKIKITYLVIIASIILTSCGTVNYQLTTVPLGVITTEGVEIKAEDGAFTLKYGENWVPPYQNSTNIAGLHYESAKMIEFYTSALNLGAKKVRVKVPYQSKELYGVLLLSKIYNGCSSAVTRSYQISIPESYVDKALNGKISVLYEYYTNCGVMPLATTKGKTWVLWLSDVPFK